MLKSFARLGYNSRRNTKFFSVKKNAITAGHIDKKLKFYFNKKKYFVQMQKNVY